MAHGVRASAGRWLVNPSVKTDFSVGFPAENMRKQNWVTQKTTTKNWFRGVLTHLWFALLRKHKMALLLLFIITVERIFAFNMYHLRISHLLMEEQGSREQGPSQDFVGGEKHFTWLGSELQVQRHHCPELSLSVIGWSNIKPDLIGFCPAVSCLTTSNSKISLQTVTRLTF